ARVLLSTEGRNLGKLIFPLGHAVVLTQITGDELRTHPLGDLRTILPPEHVVDADECDNWAAFTGTQLKERLRQLFNPIWKFSPLSGDQMRALRTILHPEIEVPRPPAALTVGTSKSDVTQLPLGPCDLKSLDLAQEGMARGLGRGHRLVFGV